MERSSATLVKNRIGCPKKAAAEISFEAQVDLISGLQNLLNGAQIIYLKCKIAEKCRRNRMSSAPKPIPIARTFLTEQEIQATLAPMRSGWLVQGLKYKSLNQGGLNSLVRRIHSSYFLH